MIEESYAYVTSEEVRHVCRKIGIGDWTALTSGRVDPAEAETVRAIVGGETSLIDAVDFRLGLEIELEHGLKFPDANITSNHPILTGRIVLAHLKEGLDYYTRLRCMELEMELAAAIAAQDAPRARAKRQALAVARIELEQRIARLGPT